MIGDAGPPVRGRVHGCFHVEDGRDEVRCQHLSGGAISDEHSVSQDEKMVGITAGKLQIVEDDDGRVPSIDERTEPLHEIKLVVNVQVSGRLVQQQEAGFLRERLGQKGALQLPTAEGHHRAVLEAVQAYIGQDGCYTVMIGACVRIQPTFVRRATQKHKLRHGKLEGEGGHLPDERQLPGEIARHPRSHVFAGEEKPAFVGLRSGHTTQEGRLAAAVGSQYADEGTCGKVEVQRLKERPGGEPDGYILCGEQRGGSYGSGRHRAAMDMGSVIRETCMPEQSVRSCAS